MQDISGKPLQTALLATSSSGVVSKDCPMHSNSERSLNSPVMSGHSLSGSGMSGGGGGGGGVVGSNSGGGGGGGSGVGSGGRSQSQLQQQQQHGRPPSLGSTVDVVSGTGGSGGRPSNIMVDDHAHLRRHQQQHHRQNDDDDDDDTGTSTSSDESGNDSFTCSEIEYDNNSVSGEKLSDVIFNKIGSSGGKSASGSSDRDSQRRRRLPLPSQLPPSSSSSSDAAVMAAQHQQQQQHQQQEQMHAAAGYDTFDSSFRGSLSTLVASDDDGPMYRNVRTPNNNPSESSSIPVGLGWDYLLNWAPSNNGMRPIMQPPSPSSPYTDHDHRLHHHHHHVGGGVGGGSGQSAADSVATRTGEGTSSSRQSPKSPEEYV